MKLGLAMIVRDAEAELPACLASAAPWVDEMVVADTGSRDRSRECARAYGARVIDLPWEEDFAAARNRGLELLRTDWVLVLDADERLDPGPDPARWRAQFQQGSDALLVTIQNYVRSLDGARVWDRKAQPNPAANIARHPETAAYPAYIEHENVRLFRRCPELYFVGRLHESVGPRVAASGLRLGRSCGRIHHFGLAIAPEAQAAKNVRYRELARRKAAEQADDFQAHFELGVMEFDNFHNDAAALTSFERSLRLRPSFALGWFYAGAALLRMGHAPEAEAFFVQAAGRGYQSPLLEEMRGDAAYNSGRYAEAVGRYRAALRHGPSERGLRSKLGLAAVRAGDGQRGLKHLRQAVAEAPGHEENLRRLDAARSFLHNAAAPATSGSDPAKSGEPLKSSAPLKPRPCAPITCLSGGIADRSREQSTASTEEVLPCP
ncbi:MAG TPA: glycosyltransferase [Terriglobales bacterium]|nr:glycosyltransferase [Terriglobales bacterium]